MAGIPLCPLHATNFGIDELFHDGALFSLSARVSVPHWLKNAKFDLVGVHIYGN